MRLITLVLAGLLAASPALAHGGRGGHGGHGGYGKGHDVGNSHHSAPLPLAGGLPAAALIAGVVFLAARARKR